MATPPPPSATALADLSAECAATGARCRDLAPWIVVDDALHASLVTATGVLAGLGALLDAAIALRAHSSPPPSGACAGGARYLPPPSPDAAQCLPAGAPPPSQDACRAVLVDGAGTYGICDLSAGHGGNHAFQPARIDGEQLDARAIEAFLVAVSASQGFHTAAASTGSTPDAQRASGGPCGAFLGRTDTRCERSARHDGMHAGGYSVWSDAAGREDIR